MHPERRENKHPRVGVGVIIIKDGMILIGERLTSRGTSTWQFPGGRFEFGETPEYRAAQEASEEAGIEITNVRKGPFVSNIFDDGSPDGAHWVTVFIIADYESGEPTNPEPDKSRNWQWRRIDDLPQPLYAPLQTLFEEGFKLEKYL